MQCNYDSLHHITVVSSRALVFITDYITMSVGYSVNYLKFPCAFGHYRSFIIIQVFWGCIYFKTGRTVLSLLVTVYSCRYYADFFCMTVVRRQYMWIKESIVCSWYCVSCCVACIAVVHYSATVVGCMNSQWIWIINLNFILKRFETENCVCVCVCLSHPTNVAILYVVCCFCNRMFL